MDHHDIHQACLSITVMVKDSKRRDNPIQERPASLAYFTIEQLQQIITRVIHEPSKPIHYFTFGPRRFRVVAYVPEDSDYITEDQTKTQGSFPVANQ